MDFWQIKISQMVLRRILSTVTILISEYLNEKLSSFKNYDKSILMNIFNKFHLASKTLGNRYGNKEPFIIRNEHDVQDILKSFLQIHYDIIGKEEITKKIANKNPRIDFLLINENVGIEVKYVSKENKQKIAGQISEDKEF